MREDADKAIDNYDGPTDEEQAARNESCYPSYSDEQARILWGESGKSAKALDRVYSVATRLCGLSKSDEAALAKNS